MKKIIISSAAILLCCTALRAQEQEPLMLSQEECRKMALAYNEDMQNADNELRKAKLDKAIAFAAYLPGFDASASGTYIYPDIDMMGMELQMRGMYAAGVTLTQPIYVGGKIRAANKLSRIGLDCAEEMTRKTRMEVLYDADNAYWTFIAVARKVRMLESYSAQMDAIYRQVETSLASQLATENDLLRISAKRSEITYQLQKARNGADLCRMALCNVIGADLDTRIIPTDTVIAVTPPEYTDESIELRPELHLLQKQIEAGEQQIRMARSEILPSVALMGGYLYYGNIKMKSLVADPTSGAYVPYTQEFKDGFAAAMLSVSVPLFHWGAGLKKVKKAKLDLENNRLALQKNSRLLSIEVRQALRNLTDSYTMIETTELGCRQAEANLQNMNTRYEASMCSLTDLLDAQAQWQQALSNRIEAQTQYKIYETDYLRATGRLE